jgi:hypothetical protein
LTGHYEGSAKNKAEEVIPVSFDLTEKEGALFGSSLLTWLTNDLAGGLDQTNPIPRVARQ